MSTAVSPETALPFSAIDPFCASSDRLGSAVLKSAGSGAGQVSGLIESVEPAGDIVQDIVAEATSVLEKGLYTR